MIGVELVMALFICEEFVGFLGIQNKRPQDWNLKKCIQIQAPAMIN